MKVLVVENDRPLAEMLRQLIGEWGHSVEVSETGIRAMQKVAAEFFDMILLDIFLPDARGYELIPQIYRLHPETQIVTMTGYNSRDLERKVRKEGVLYFMEKPFDTKTLKQLIDHVAAAAARQKEEPR